MKVALICPSNMLYMPYVENYEKILKDNDIDYDIINWDRFNIEEEIEFRYRDSKVGHQRNCIDYYRFRNFIIKKLNGTRYDKLVVFGIQLTYFLKRILRKQYTGRYVIDIRDHNRIIKYFNIDKVIKDSSFTVLSSPGFKQWLPKSNKYIINHNTQVSNLSLLREIRTDRVNKNQVNIAYIGAIRDYQINIDFIDVLKNRQNVLLNFHGEGDINKKIQEHLNAKKIHNVRLTGRYSKDEEEQLYYSNDLINVLRYNDGINNKTALPNRLYNAAIYGKPMLAYKGTQLAEEIQKYELGLVVNSFENIGHAIDDYLKNFDVNKYEKGRRHFFKLVIGENLKYEEKMKEFIIQTQK